MSTHQSVPSPRARPLRAALLAGLLTLPAWPVAAGTLTTLYSFQGASDGESPFGALIYHAGYLYGATSGTGYTDCTASDCGTLFRIDPASGAETIMYTFTGQTGVLPLGDMALDHNKLVGATYAGGASNFGTVFSFDIASGHAHVLHSFAGDSDGADPEAGPILANGTYYGTTSSSGGDYDLWGTIYAIDATTGAYSVLFRFTNTKREGGHPAAPLLYVDGTLYGTAMGGGIKDRYGTAYALDTASGTFTVLHEFDVHGDAYEPSAAMIDAQGELLGTAQQGGKTLKGAVYGINPATGAESVPYSFRPVDGTGPGAALLVHGTNYYGTTISDGAHGLGTIFEINPATGRVHSRYSFSGTDGANPTGALIYQDGAFYGTTRNGGAYGYGTVFKFVP
jgi:uncharacterized repeat protein (TIGR03803 family)